MTSWHENCTTFSLTSSLKGCDPVTAGVLGQLLRFLAVCVALPLTSYPWSHIFWHGKMIWLSCTACVSAPQFSHFSKELHFLLLKNV